MTATIPSIQSRLGGHAAVEAELTSLYERTRPSVVQVYRGNGNGAGTIWRSSGEENVILVRGSVPGAANEYVVVTMAATRKQYKRKGLGKEEVRSKNPCRNLYRQVRFKEGFDGNHRAGPFLHESCGVGSWAIGRPRSVTIPNA